MVTYKPKTTRAKRAAAVERITTGQSTVEIEAAKLRVSPGAIRRFLAEAKKTALIPSSTTAPQDDDADGPSPDLDRALKSAGAAGVPESGDLGSAASPAPAPSAPSPEELVEFAAIFQTELLTGYGSLIGLDMARPDIAAAIAMPETKKKSLRFLAPFAAAKAPEVAQKIGDVAAWGFVGLYALGMLGSFRALAAIAAEDKKKTLGPQGRGVGAPIEASAVDHRQPAPVG